MAQIPSPVTALFVTLLGSLFVVLFIAWCCKQCSRSKHAITTLILPQDSIYNRRLISAIDVQTGLPVVIQTVGRNSRNLVRITSLPGAAIPCSINSERRCTLYGTMIQDSPPRDVSVLSRTPPPPYSEVYQQPRV